jgi:hypothetical protein
MSDTGPRQTATIYYLSERVKLAATSVRRKAASASPVKPVAPVLSGECWYHEAAMREADSERKG